MEKIYSVQKMVKINFQDVVAKDSKYSYLFCFL